MADLTTQEMLPLLQTWATRHAELSDPLDKLVDVFGGSYEGPLFDAVLNVWDDYTAALSTLIGDKHQWLMWFHAENDMGAKGMPVRVGETTMTLRTLQDLADAIVKTRDSSGRAPSVPALEDLEIELLQAATMT